MAHMSKEPYEVTAWPLVVMAVQVGTHTHVDNPMTLLLLALVSSTRVAVRQQPAMPRLC